MKEAKQAEDAAMSYLNSVRLHVHMRTALAPENLSEEGLKLLQP
ncbi:MAG: hypothetical protein PUC76_05570 [Clostridia bacterium]|nr:hypothetical protein [Clostridia bacterium]